MRSRYSIQTKIMIFFNSIAILLFIMVGLLFYRSTEGAINSSKRSELTTLATETANKIDRFLFERYGDIQVMAESPLFSDGSIDKGLKLEYLDSVRKAYKTYDYIFIADLKGRIEVLSGTMSNKEDGERLIDQVFHGGTVVSDYSYDTKSRSYCVYFASPIRINGRIAGAVVERMNFDSIYDIVKRVKPGDSGYAYLYKSKDDTMFQPKGYKPEIEPGFSSGTLEHNGIEYVFSKHPVKRYGTQQSNWYLVVEEPASEAYRVADNLKSYTVIIVVISVIALFILGTFISRFITTPIQRLVSETQRAALGNLGQSINVDSRDEIGSLATSINTLMDNLKAMMQQVLSISAEAASLEEIRQYADSFFENIPGGIITIDNQGAITSMNKAALQMTRLDSAGELLQSEWKPLYDLLLETVEQQVMYKKHILRIGASETALLVNTTIQKDPNGNMIGAIAAFKPLEEIRQLEASVVRAKNLAALGELSAGMAHEIRNPLTSIKGYAQYIKSELESDELMEDISIIIHEVDKLNGILDRFLAFARPRELKPKEMDLNKVLQGVVRLLKGDAGERVHFAVEYGQLHTFLFDADQLEQAIMNIMLNSIQAMPEGGTLTLKTRYDAEAGVAVVEISDTGCGIPQDAFDRIFEPFYTTKDKGTGLGLAIASRIIEAHEGFLEVASIQGKGTTFTIKLPVGKKVEQ